MNKVNHELLDIESIADIISYFAFEDKGVLPMSEQVFKMYPTLRGNISKEDVNLKNNIANLIEEQYDKFLIDNKNIVNDYNLLIGKYSKTFFETLNNYFGIEKSYDIKAYIGDLPVCPRNIQDETYCISKTSYKNIVSIFMHEVCHFAFFKKCEDLFINFSDSDMDNPSLLWYLSEIIVDPILNKDEFQNVFNYEFGAYDSFYKMEINGENLMDTIKGIFNACDSENAIIKSYEFLLKNEKEFRKLCGDETGIQNKEFILKDKNIKHVL